MPMFVQWRVKLQESRSPSRWFFRHTYKECSFDKVPSLWSLGHPGPRG